MESHEMLDRLGASQHGLVSGAQLGGLGFTADGRHHLVESGRLFPVRRGVYRLCGSVPTWRSEALAAVMAAGAGAVLSHRTAATLWGLLDHRRETGPFEITVGRHARLSGVVAHRHRLRADEVTSRYGIPVTVPARTLVDLAESIGVEELGQLVDEALRGRVVTLGGLRNQMASNVGRGRRRQKEMRAVLRERGGGYDPGDSAWERRMDRLWDEWGLPPAARQHRIVVNGHLYVVDRAIVDLAVAVEWNGYEYHGLRTRFDRDSTRRAELTAAGWAVLDFTTRSSPALICSSVMSVVEQRRRERGMPPWQRLGAPADTPVMLRP
jgi:hypothetical protein